MDIYQHDDSFRQQGFGIIAGIDEAGRGPIAGPVVAAAVILPVTPAVTGLRDSKKVPERERERLFWDILTGASDIGIGIVDHDEIDRLNILKATRHAMMSAVNDLNVRPDMVIIDAVTLPPLRCRQVSLIRADAKSASVAAASIVAKYVRDMIMIRYHDEYPAYNFRKHKGYCTREHIEMIALYGPCTIHRKTFQKVMSPDLPFPS